MKCTSNANDSTYITRFLNLILVNVGSYVQIMKTFSQSLIIIFVK